MPSGILTASVLLAAIQQQRLGSMQLFARKEVVQDRFLIKDQMKYFANTLQGLCGAQHLAMDQLPCMRRNSFQRDEIQVSYVPVTCFSVFHFSGTKRPTRW